MRIITLSLLAATALAAACGTTAQEPVVPEAPDESEASAATGAQDPLRAQARGLFGTLPAVAEAKADNPMTDAKITLGRTLYFETRLSASGEMSCNTCHQLESYGVDHEPTSPGHAGVRGDRNSPTVYNAALHAFQFWDGRAEDVEAQAVGPITNPVEMGMADGPQVVGTLKGIAGYGPLFEAAFPGDPDPITLANVGNAIGAFERTLLTPAPFDAWLAGDDAALSAPQRAGLQAFVETGCVSCHMGPTLGGQAHMKLGQVEPYPTEDIGRAKVTGADGDRFFFKVPSLRNVAETGPWLHDGSVRDLPAMVRLMAKHQLGRELTDAQVTEIVAFLESLTGTVAPEAIARPTLPDMG